MKNWSLLLLSALFVCCGGSKPDPTPDPQPPVTPGEQLKAAVYTTSMAGARMKESELTLQKPEDVNFYKVNLDGNSYQTVDGFGLAITQASCYNLLVMKAEDRRAFLEEIFSREKGIGSSLIRVCIGGSDFSLDEFTWCDTPGMEHFAVHPLDQEYLFPILDQIMAINPDVKLIGSPWSCPRWMKMAENGGAYDAWTGGRLNPVYYEDYATYFVKWIQEMERRGYCIMAVTLQNEPLHRGNSMSTYMSWQEQSNFIKRAVGPAFKAAGLKTKILLYDHNYSYDNTSGQQDYPLHIFEDAEAGSYSAGSAWHNYGGSVTVLDDVHQRFPDKDIYFTEASIGSWNYSFGDCLINDFRDIFLGTLSRWCKGVTLWNLMLDYQGKPFRPRGCSTCYGAVSISQNDYSLESIVRNSHYYDVAHCSKVLMPGAVRLGTSGNAIQGVTCQLYRNPDGSLAALLLNEGRDDALVNIVTGKYSVGCRIPPRAIQSVIWQE